MLANASYAQEAIYAARSWAFLLFVGLAIAVLTAVACWLTVVEAWSDGKAGAGAILKRVSEAVLATAAAVGAWYALAFVVLQ